MDIRERIKSYADDKMVTISVDNRQAEFSVPARDLKRAMGVNDPYKAQMDRLRDEYVYDPHNTINS